MNGLRYVICLMIGLTACGEFPMDPENTLFSTKNGVLKVGITHHPPFTVVDGKGMYQGLEVEMINVFADELHASVEWVNDSESALFEMLEKQEIDMVVGGITKQSLFRKKAGFSRPYLQSGPRKYVWAVAPGENAFMLKVEDFLFRTTQDRPS